MIFRIFYDKDILYNKNKGENSRWHRSIFIDYHNEYISFMPANLPGVNTELNKMLLLASEEAKDKGINTRNLPLGANTHKLSFAVEYSLYSSKILIYLDLNKSNPLDRFNEFIEQFQTTRFLLGRIPFYNSRFFHAMKQLTYKYKHSFITKVFIRNNKIKTRIAISNDSYIFNLKPVTLVDIDFDDNDDNNITELNTNSSVPFELDYEY